MNVQITMAMWSKSLKKQHNVNS